MPIRLPGMVEPSAATAIQLAIEQAALSAQRDPRDITLIGVIKGQPLERITTVLAQTPALKDLGENYLNEALVHQAQLGRDPWVWHYIGQLQTNKTKAIATHFDWVHTVDRLKVIERLNDQRPFHGPKLNICIQANLWNEASKGGATAAELRTLAHAVAQSDRLTLRGLMALPPETSDPIQQRAQFDELAHEFKTLQQHGFPLDTLSMGMSGDFAAAIGSGATHIRIGSALFGAREKKT